MKRSRGFLRTACSAVLLLNLALLNSSCWQDSPTGPTDQGRQRVRILGFAETSQSLKKHVTSSKMVKAGEGGTLELLAAGDTLGNSAGIQASLIIAPGSIDADTEISFSMDAATLDFRFDPSGLVFRTPALFNVEAHGIEPSGVVATGVQLLYDDVEGNQWDRMPHEGIVLEPSSGRVRLVNGRIPHFSRYILADE